MVSERVVCREFVGRAVELEHLRARRRAAAEGRGGLVLIAGEAGIGKSRLVREFCARLSPARHRIGLAACREFGDRPLKPLTQVLRAAVGASPLERRAASREEQREALVAAFDRAGENATAILALDDLQWADAELLATLEVLAERGAGRRVLLLGTYRDDEIVPDHPLFVRLGRLLRHDEVSLLRLGPLAEDDAKRLLRGALAQRTTLAQERQHEILRRAGGNPLFTEELLRHVVDCETAGSARTEHDLPLSVHAVVRERLNRCTADERGLLAHASLFGRRFRADLLAEIAEVPLATLIAPLQRLCELQLLDAREGVVHGFQFRHALTRDAVYGEMLAEQTRPRHLRIARVLAARPDAAAFAEMIAHSLCAAGELAAAAPYCELAGDEARAVHAYDESAAWYERAASGRRGDDAALAAVLTQAAESLMRADAIDRVIPVRDAAAAAYLRAGEVDRAANEWANVVGAYGNDGRFAAAREAGRAALQEIPASAVRARARLAIRIAALEAANRDPDEAWAQLACVAPDALGTEGNLALEYAAVVSSVHAQRSDLPAWRAAFGRAMALCDASADGAYIRRWLPGTVAVQALNVGETAIAREYQGRSLALARNEKLDLSYALAVAAQIELRAGNLETASRLIAEARPTREYLPRHQRAIAGIGIAVARGDRAALERLLDAQLVESEVAGSSDFRMIEGLCAFGAALIALGRTREAMPQLRRAAEAMRSPFGLSEPIALFAQHAPALAAAIRPLLAASASTPGDRVHGALLDLVDAAIAGDEPARRAFAERAAARFGAIGWPLFAAQALELAGRSEDALAAYERCGAAGEVRRMRRASRRRAVRTVSLLTQRERAIAELIAAGNGNRGTAAALAVSEKSIEKSLTAIYAKLGIRSRAQLAAYVAVDAAQPDAGSA